MVFLFTNFENLLTEQPHFPLFNRILENTLPKNKLLLEGLFLSLAISIYLYIQPQLLKFCIIR